MDSFKRYGLKQIHGGPLNMICVLEGSGQREASNCQEIFLGLFKKNQMTWQFKAPNLFLLWSFDQYGIQYFLPEGGTRPALVLGNEELILWLLFY